jgi:hypothetical protein
MPNPIVQSGVLDGGAGEHYFFPSIAANANSDACLGFTRSDGSRFAEAVFTGRLASDPAGTMQSIQLLKAGESSYSKFFSGTENRWGDYSNTAVDPSDDLTFWTIQEYASQNAGSGRDDGRWGTWWGKISPQGSLPIQLASFTAVGSASGAVRLDWMTVSEINNYGFDVERRGAADVAFVTLPQGFVPGHGTTASPQHYSFTDSPAGAGRWYYRLKQVDLGGFASYSEEAVVELGAPLPASAVPSQAELLPNYPNPFNPTTTIRYGISGKSHVTLAVFNTLGQPVALLVDGVEEAGYHQVSFGAASLASGVYFYRIRAGDFVQTKRLTLLR